MEEVIEEDNRKKYSLQMFKITLEDAWKKRVLEGKTERLTFERKFRPLNGQTPPVPVGRFVFILPGGLR